MKPIIDLATSGVRSHDSHACVRVEHTAVLYILIFMLKGRRWSFQSLEREEKAAWAIFIRCSIALCLAPQVDKRMYVVYLFSLDCDVGTAVFLRFSFLEFDCFVSKQPLTGSL